MSRKASEQPHKLAEDRRQQPPAQSGHGPLVERVVKPDGRYVIYYRWPKAEPRDG